MRSICYGSALRCGVHGRCAVQPGDTDVFFLSQATAISLWMLAMGAAVIVGDGAGPLTPLSAIIRQQLDPRVRAGALVVCPAALDNIPWALSDLVA
ncbi:MAG: hypothetical protein IPO97_07965 [Sphingomonadales bacterium]|nr:hypothetical protein [Sphingomonadales bacterium]